MKNTVKRQIFTTNAAAVLLTLAIMIALNGILIAGYFESVEREWEDSLEAMDPESGIEDVLEEWTIHKKSFLVVAVLDVAVCGLILVVVSTVFTRRLTRHIMEPLQELEEGAKRIRSNDLSEKIDYQGDLEFELLCNTFNDMQQHLQDEQVKNAKYEQARADMIAGISHDLRTPLTAVRGTIKGLLDGVADTPQQREKFLKVAYQRTEDMNSLLSHLFMVSRMETGDIPLHMEEIDLQEWLPAYINEKRSMTGEDISITFTKGNVDNSRIFADREQLKRIFDNLLGNSIKYAEVKPLEIHIALKEEYAIQDERKWITVSFADNGIGVREDQLAHLFEEFYRGDESRNRKEGNGLGLYIVKYLMQAFGGSVAAENRDGLTVYLTFQMKEKEQ